MEPIKTSTSVADMRKDIFRLTEARDFLGAYRHLISQGFTVEAAPALWELLARRCTDFGATKLACDMHRALWEVGIVSADSAVILAEDALALGDRSKAEAIVTEAFGPTPDEERARQVLARVVADHSPKRAIDLIEPYSLKSADNAVLTIDVLRRAERIQEASDILRQAKPKFPTDGRFDVRRARIHEALSEWQAALDAWDTVVENGGGAQFGAELNQARLLLRLEHRAKAMDTACAVLSSDGRLDERIQIAATFGLTSLISASVQAAFHSWRRDATSVKDWDRACRSLMSLGMVGTLTWLKSRDIPLPVAVRDAIDIGLSAERRQKIEALSFSAAAELQAPQIFLDRITMRSRRSDTKPSQPGTVLIINSTLAAGGSERQLVVLCAALIKAGWAAEDIHLGFFSLSADRRHQHFLNDILELGVTIHRLDDIDAGSCDLSQSDQAKIAMFPAQLRSDVFQVTGLVQGIRPSVLHGWQDRSALACGWVGLANKVDRIVLSARNMQPQKRGMMQRYAAPMLRAFCDCPNVIMTANAEACAKDYEAWLGLPPNTIQPLRNGVRAGSDISLGRPPIGTRNHAGMTIGGVFRLAANKRPFLWLHTIAELQKVYAEPIRVRLVGRGPFRRDVVELAEQLAISDLELVDDLNAPEDIYAGMDAVLLMSRIEGLPNVVLEAQAEGLPVAACDVGGVREALCLDYPGAGLLLPPDPTASEAARLLSDWLPTALIGGQETRQAFIDRHFGMAALASSVRQIYLGQSEAV